MRSPENFSTLLLEVIGQAYFLVPAAVCLGAAVLVAVSKRSDWTRSRRGDLPLILLPALIGVLILVCGTVFASDRSQPSDLGVIWL